MDTDNPFGKFHENPGIPSLLSESAGKWTPMCPMLR